MCLTGSHHRARQPFTDPAKELSNAQQEQQKANTCVKSGTSCSTYTVTADDPTDKTWLSLAAKLGVNPYDLLRANPLLGGNTTLVAGQIVFVGPCNSGGESLVTGD